MLTTILYRLVDIYSWLIIIWALSSWFPLSGKLLDLRYAVGMLVEPYLAIFRRYIPPIGGVMDISPVVAILVLQMLEAVLARFSYSIMI